MGGRVRRRTVHGIAEVDDERVGDVSDVPPDVVGHEDLQAHDGLRVEHCGHDVSYLVRVLTGERMG